MTRLKRLASATLQHFLMATMEGLRKAGLARRFQHGLVLVASQPFQEFDKFGPFQRFGHFRPVMMVMESPFPTVLT